MTDALKPLIIVFSFFVIITLLIAGVNTKYMILQKEDQLRQLSARKEDLQLQQQRIETIISDLNKTIELEVLRQKIMEASITSDGTNSALQQQLIDAQNAINQAVTPTPPVITPTTPKVTQAS